MSILLIRHGETAANAARVVQLPTEPLNQRGLGQARRVAERIQKEHGGEVLGILASDLERAAMTATAISATTGVPIASEPLLQERNFGDLRSRPYAELGFDPMADGYQPPAGESWDQFHRRAARAWRRVAEVARSLGDRGCLVVVTHGLICRSFAERHLSLDPRSPPARWGNTSLTRIERRPPWRVSLLNCTEHLDGELDDAASSASGL